MMDGKCIAGIVVVGVFNAGCALDAPKPQAHELPAAFEHQLHDPRSHWPSQDWFSGFASAELDGLVAQATSHNLDLAIAKARVAQADARARQARSVLLPGVDAGGKANYLAGRSSNGSAHETDWSALLTASYEFDFWDKNRSSASDGARLPPRLNDALKSHRWNRLPNATP